MVSAITFNHNFPEDLYQQKQQGLKFDQFISRLIDWAPEILKQPVESGRDLKIPLGIILSA